MEVRTGSELSPDENMERSPAVLFWVAGLSFLSLIVLICEMGELDHITF